MNHPATRTFEQQRARLLARLRAVRRVGVGATLAAGAAQASLAGAGALLLAIGLDWLLRLPGPLRLALGVGLLAFWGVALHGTVIRRLRLPDLAAVARQVARGVGGPPDGLASGVEFAVGGASGYWSGRTISLAADLSDRLSTARLIRWRWAVGWLVVAAAVFVVFGGSSMQGWLARGAARLSWPIVRTSWPKRVRIDSPQIGRAFVVPPGEPLLLEARIARGSPRSAAWLVLRDSTGSPRRLDMTVSGEALRSITIRPVRSSAFWFEAGDDSTQDRPGLVRVTPRPQVAGAQGLVRPPAYTGQALFRVSLGAGAVRIPAGSDVELTIRATKPLAERDGRPVATITVGTADAADAAATQAGAPSTESLDVRFGSDRGEIVGCWRCNRDVLVGAAFTDEDGLESPPLQPWRITVERDWIPTIEIQSPADNLEVTPAAVLPLRAVVRDDWGLSELRQAWQVTRSSGPQDQAPSVQPLPFEQTKHDGDTVSLSINRSWPLADLVLAAGDRVEWYLEARDNFELDGGRHAPVRSPAMTLRVIDETAMLTQTLARLAAARQGIEALHAQQQALRDALRAAAVGEPSAQDLRGWTDRQAQLAGQAAWQGGDLAAAAQRLRTNRVSRADLTESIEKAAGELARAASGEMAAARRPLEAAARRQPAPADEVREAAASASDATDALERILRATSVWTTLESAALGLRTLIEQQGALREQTAQAGAQALGLPAEQLGGAAGAALRTLAEAQRSLADRLGRIQADMAGHGEAPGLVPAEQSQRLRAAAELLEKQAAVGAMAAAADQIARNVTMAAQRRQQVAGQAMREALNLLRGQGRPAEGARQDGGQPSFDLPGRLRELAALQMELMSRTGQIDARRDAGGNLNRADLLRLSLAAASQADLGRQVQQVRQQAKAPAVQQLLDAVSQWMDGIAGQIQSGSSGRPVQDAQQQAAQALTSLAEAYRGESPALAEDRPGGESAASGQRQQQAGAQQEGGQPGRGGTQSAADERVGGGGADRAAAPGAPPAGRVESWGFLPPDQRREVLQGMQEQPPARYRKLTERYWQVLNESVEQQSRGAAK